MSNPLVSIVIPNWNGLRFLQTCLDSLAQQTYTATEVIIADNASTDGSQAFIRDYAPQVVLVELPENRGFTGACNAGMEAATGEIVILLNNDTEVDPGWVAAIVDAFDRYPDAGMVASKMLLFEQRDHIHTAGDGFTIDGRPFNRGVWQKDEGQFDQEEYVFSACGGSSAYRRTMLDEIGLLDDDYFFLMEDVDLGWRAQLAGWRALYTPHAIVYHHLSATGGGVTASFHDGRNNIYLLVKNVPGDIWRKHRWAIIGRQARIAWDALKAWRGEAARAHLRGIASGLWHIPALLKKRRQVQATRRVSTTYIESVLSPVQD
ncbi:glycosyltransferase family 2 protein [Phototrophicus methaneseepsis]|uniref:Glycosyltransferase family 2 protein n=1 Tax=Phototrophicus methaneseepsis TaxID=2710758 RepID=A0A7S8IGT8_9CHLR|nr:glycosyltransferase family 2 protein [Phototrophicus methaneseepsis]QPC85034.1 glycosyltransferase family 2 protein [Phototrophicus methaneseepsis]